MSSAEAAQWFGKILERYGFATVVACALLFFLRQDIVLPLVDEHRSFLREMVESQQELTRAMNEQTRILYAIYRREPVYSYESLPDFAGGTDPDDTQPQN